MYPQKEGSLGAHEVTKYYEVQTGPNTSAHNLHTFLRNTRDITDPPK